MEYEIHTHFMFDAAIGDMLFFDSHIGMNTHGTGTHIGYCSGVPHTVDELGNPMNGKRWVRCIVAQPFVNLSDFEASLGETIARLDGDVEGQTDPKSEEKTTPQYLLDENRFEDIE